MGLFTPFLVQKEGATGVTPKCLFGIRAKKIIHEYFIYLYVPLMDMYHI